MVGMALAELLFGLPAFVVLASLMLQYAMGFPQTLGNSWSLNLALQSL